MERAAGAQQKRLHQLVAALLFGGGAWTGEAVTLASDLLQAGHSGPATARLASLPATTPVRDARLDLEAFIAEHGLDVPPAPAEAPVGSVPWLSFLYRAVGAGVLTVEHLVAHHYADLPPWDEQSSAVRDVTIALNEYEMATSEPSRRQLAQAVRAAAARLPTAEVAH